MVTQSSVAESLRGADANNGEAGSGSGQARRTPLAHRPRHTAHTLLASHSELHPLHFTPAFLALLRVAMLFHCSLVVPEPTLALAVLLACPPRLLAAATGNSATAAAGCGSTTSLRGATVAAAGATISADESVLAVDARYGASKSGASAWARLGTGIALLQSRAAGSWAPTAATPWPCEESALRGQGGAAATLSGSRSAMCGPRCAPVAASEPSTKQAPAAASAARPLVVDERAALCPASTAAAAGRVGRTEGGGDVNTDRRESAAASTQPPAQPATLGGRTLTTAR